MLSRENSEIREKLSGIMIDLRLGPIRGRQQCYSDITRFLVKNIEGVTGILSIHRLNADTDFAEPLAQLYWYGLLVDSNIKHITKKINKGSVIIFCRNR